MHLSPFMPLLDSWLCISCFLSLLSFFSSFKFWHDFSLKHKGYSTNIAVLWKTVSAILFNILLVDNLICFHNSLLSTMVNGYMSLVHFLEGWPYCYPSVHELLEIVLCIIQVTTCFLWSSINWAWFEDFRKNSFLTSCTFSFCIFFLKSCIFWLSDQVLRLVRLLEWKWLPYHPFPNKPIFTLQRMRWSTLCLICNLKSGAYLHFKIVNPSLTLFQPG